MTTPALAPKKKKPPPKRSPTLPNQSSNEQITSALVVIVAILLAYGGGRYVRTSIHQWVDQKYRDAISPSPVDQEQGAPRILTITPNTTSLKADAAVYQEFLGSEVTLLEDQPPPLPEGTSCVYLFLQVTPKTPKADMHKDWASLGTKDVKSPCRVMAVADTDSFTDDLLELDHLEMILCHTRQCVSDIQEKQRDRQAKIPILYSGFTSQAPPASAGVDPDRFNKFLHVTGPSPHDGTATILQAWLQHPDWPTLTVASSDSEHVQQVLQEHELQELPSNIKHIHTQLTPDELDALMHRHGVYLCLYGLQGHCLNQARAAGALVLAPSGTEWISEDTGVLLAGENGVSVGAPELIRVMNEVVLKTSLEERKERGERATEAFVKDRELFQQRMEQLKCYVNKCTDLQKQQSCAEGCELALE